MWEVAGLTLTAGGLVEVKADVGLAARLSAGVLVGTDVAMVVGARSILSSTDLSMGRFRPRVVATFCEHGLGVLWSRYFLAGASQFGKELNAA